MTSGTGSLLQSIQILVTGVPEKEKRHLHELAKSQGAVILSTANANDPPHVVITRTVGSPRYFTILKRNANIPIVTPEWLTSSIEKSTRLPYADFAAGVFQGLVICFSGLSVAEKKEFSKQVESEGGSHSPVLDRSCTHLVTDSTQSDKFLYAQLHRICTITPAWIEESLAAGRCIHPAKYLITKPIGSSQHHSQQQNSHLARQASLQQKTAGQLQRDGSGLTGDVTDNTLDNNNNSNNVIKVDAPGRSDSEEPSLRRVVVVDATGRGAAGAAAETTRPSSRLGNPSTTAAVGNVDTATPVAAAWTILDHDDNSPLFLDSCFVWVTCCTPAEEQETLVLCAQGGAKRFLEPHPTLTTHVVVGSNTAGDNANSVVVFHSEHKEVPLVNLEWLRRSVARRQVEIADVRFSVTLPSGSLLANSNGATGRGGVGLLGNGGGSMSLLGFNSNDSNSLPVVLNPNNNLGNVAGKEIFVGGGDGDPSSAAAAAAYLLNRQNSGAASLMGGFLDKCYFTLAAVRGTPEGDAAERLIRMHGGRLFSTSVPTSSKACFAICPYSLPSHKVHALRNALPDFAAVPETHRFTLWWLECCVQAGEVLPHTAGTACFQPLPFVLPLKDFDKISVSISGYDPSVRAAIQRTVEIVGGHVSLEYMTAKDTHLIVPSAIGKKYKFAARYGVIPVTAAWLLESVKAGKVLPPNNFAPLLPEGGMPTGHKDTTTTAAATLTDQQPQQRPGSASLLPPIGTQQTLPTNYNAGGGGIGGATTSLYAAAIAGPSALNNQQQSNFPVGGGGGGSGKSAKPSLKQKAQRLREAAKQRPGLLGSTQQPPVGAAKKPAVTAFDFDSLMGPLQNSRVAGGGGGGGNIASAAIASLLGGGAGAPLPPGTALLPPLHQPAPAVFNPETEGASELDAAVLNVSSMLDRLKGRGGALAGSGSGHSSQHDMPPPPARGGGGIGQEEGGSEDITAAGGGGGGKRRRRSRGEDSGGGAGPRRSTRRGGVISGISELMESEGIELSQQVGYESAAVVEVATMGDTGKGGHEAVAAAVAAKERLTRAASRNRRGQTNSRDILEGF